MRLASDPRPLDLRVGAKRPTPRDAPPLPRHTAALRREPCTDDRALSMVRDVNLLILAGGLVLIAWVLWDAFETILLTRRVPARLRISRFVLSWLWIGWAAIARGIAERG